MADNHKEPECFKEARQYIRSETSPNYDRLMVLVGDLAREFRFDYARRLVANYRGDLENGRLSGDEIRKLTAEKRLKLAHKHSLYTYKDPDLPAADRLEMARTILHRMDDLTRSTNQETLGQAGAIFKRKWEIDGQSAHLERSFHYYERAYRQGILRDDGYTAVNAAFVLDLLANQRSVESSGTGQTSLEADQLRSRAQDIRREIVGDLTPRREEKEGHNRAEKKPPGAGLGWLYASLGEAHYGLGDYVAAREALESFVGTQPAVWEKESASRQLARLYFLRTDSMEEPEAGAWEALSPLLGRNPEAIRAAFVGKVGLALSGGGFRASIFHLGVLARLAELHLLRYVEVISCVSGGAIVGAHYYLALQKRLEKAEDGALTQEDYVDLVKEVATQFLGGVQKNLRMRLLTSPWTCLKAAFLSSYSHTNRAGELFEHHLFRHAGTESPKERFMGDLKTQPRGAPPGFNPRLHNWQRADKVPILALNATALNTGHNWQFTATWMGEPPTDMGTGIDANDWLRRLPYAKAPAGHRKVRLGYAVAASACVPGLFRPLEMAGLYRGGWKVRLVDGGVHDNQGVATLLEQECTVMLVSDASGQSPSDKHPGSDALAVPMRANDILMGRVRQEQHRRLAALEASGRLRGLMFIHLRRGLAPEPVDWEECDEDAKYFLDYGSHAAGLPGSAASPRLVPPDIQRLLAGIRTDLDSFSDGEAYALMTSGYRQAEQYIPASLRPFARPRPLAEPWFFLQVENLFSTAGERGGRDEKLVKVLSAGEFRAFKVFRLSKLAWALPVALALGLGAVLAGTYESWSKAALRVPVSWIAFFLVAMAVLAVLGKVGAGKVKNAVFSIPRRVLWVVFAAVGWILAWLYLLTLDKLYLKKGRLGLGGPHHKRKPARASAGGGGGT